MAKTTINIIKSWFKTGLKPTQDQFWSWQDSYWHKDEIIPQENIQNLSTTLSSKADADQLANKANADATGLTQENITAWNTKLKTLSDAPSDDKQYARKNGVWEVITISGGGGNTGPTYDKNGVFYLNGLLRLNPVYATELGSTAGTKALVMKQDGSVHTVPISALGGSTGITPVPAPSPKNKLAGKKISFIGDSITSFGDGTPEYNSATGYTYDDVWSGLVLKLTGGVLGTLDGVAGSTVQGSTYDAFAFRRSKSVAQDSDYIFIFMGANDQRLNRNLGTIKPKGTLGDITDASNPNLNEFTGAYQLALESMLNHYQKSQIVLMTPLKAFNKDNIGDLNLNSDAFAERVIELAKLYGIRYIDMREIGITGYNHKLYYYDGLHPNKKGHMLIAEYVVGRMVEFGVVDGSGGGGATIDAYTKSQTDEKINNIIIGGANLLKNTALPKFAPNTPGEGGKNGTGNSVTMSDNTGYFVRHTPDEDKVVATYGMFLAGSNLGSHTRSMDFRHFHTENITIWGQSIPPNVWVRIKQENFTSTNGWSTFTCDTAGVAIDVRNYKIELGSKATDWTPHISEYNLGASPNMIDQVFPWTIDGLGIVAEENGDNDRALYNLPYIDFIVNILEFYFVFTDGSTKRVDGLKVARLSSGKKGIAFNASIVEEKTPTKMYLKALLK
nr:MAG TPA: GDSL like Lipase Acylhydrolase [Caudoviricetes sp.]